MAAFCRDIAPSCEWYTFAVDPRSIDVGQRRLVTQLLWRFGRLFVYYHAAGAPSPAFLFEAHLVLVLARFRLSGPRAWSKGKGSGEQYGRQFDGGVFRLGLKICRFVGRVGAGWYERIEGWKL